VGARVATRRGIPNGSLDAGISIKSPMKATIELPDPLAARAERLADERGISVGRLILEALEDRLDALEDPLFSTYAIYEGPAPSDLSERIDDYLFEEEK
jgi:predicted transcriptional regulator